MVWVWCGCEAIALVCGGGGVACLPVVGVVVAIA
jgi:hypothetical protein